MTQHQKIEKKIHWNQSLLYAKLVCTRPDDTLRGRCTLACGSSLLGKLLVLLNHLC
jgi:hypothetical protein